LVYRGELRCSNPSNIRFACGDRVSVASLGEWARPTRCPRPADSATGCMGGWIRSDDLTDPEAISNSRTKSARHRQDTPTRQTTKMT
jgi:hypothetical protein